MIERWIGYGFLLLIIILASYGWTISFQDFETSLNVEGLESFQVFVLSAITIIGTIGLIALIIVTRKNKNN